MFFGRLNQKQRESFLALATKMALADAKVKPEEVDLLEDIAREFGHDISVRPDEIYGRTNTEPFDTRESRVIAVLGMLVVAFSDRHFHVDESTVLDEAAQAFGFNSVEIMHMKTWAQREAALVNEYHTMIEEGD